MVKLFRTGIGDDINLNYHTKVEDIKVVIQGKQAF